MDAKGDLSNNRKEEEWIYRIYYYEVLSQGGYPNPDKTTNKPFMTDVIGDPRKLIPEECVDSDGDGEFFSRPWKDEKEIIGRYLLQELERITKASRDPYRDPNPVVIGVPHHQYALRHRQFCIGADKIEEIGGGDARKNSCIRNHNRTAKRIVI